MIDFLMGEFQKVFGDTEGTRGYFAPGRVNLIGEHTDYNGGHVFPCALTIGTYAIVKDREDDTVRFHSLNFADDGIISTSLNDIQPDGSWTDYPKGVMWAFEGRGLKLTHGFDMLVYGDIPNGSGLSSSASLEVLTGIVLKDTFRLYGVTMVELAQIGQYSENNFNHCNCGIMDQFASAMGLVNNAIFLDTNTLVYKYVPLKLDGAKIVITNSKVKHSLVTSAYNDRRNECETALKELQKVVEIGSLGELDGPHFERFRDAITSPVCQKRAKHAVYENQRTIDAVKALSDSDVESFGRLMNESHRSLKEDYEVSCPEIDYLVAQAQAIPGVIGSRITGGGFGGCTVSIVKDEAVDTFRTVIGEGYKKKFDLDAEFYVVNIGNGVHRIF